MIPVSSGSLFPEPPYQHGTVEKTGILFVNLGTPTSPTTEALKVYLKEFLSDPRVVEIPKLLWWPILNLIILNFRPKRSAEKYASIWSKNGSPLRFFSEKQVEKVEKKLILKGINVKVMLAMRYGKPSIEEVIKELKKQAISRILILPLYPQFSASTTATVFDKVFEQLNLNGLVVGHTPQENGIQSSCYQKLWKIDTGMSGAFCHKNPNYQVLEVLDDGQANSLNNFKPIRVLSSKDI